VKRKCNHLVRWSKYTAGPSFEPHVNLHFCRVHTLSEKNIHNLRLTWQGMFYWRGGRGGAKKFRTIFLGKKKGEPHMHSKVIGSSDENTWSDTFDFGSQLKI
jgi:hypothetical protein